LSRGDSSGRLSDGTQISFLTTRSTSWRDAEVVVVSRHRLADVLAAHAGDVSRTSARATLGDSDWVGRLLVDGLVCLGLGRGDGAVARGTIGLL
jgi:hypothetical protein